MHTESDGTEHMSRAARSGLGTGVSLALFAVLAMASVAATQEAAQEAAPGEGATEAPRGLPPANWPTSPHRGVIDGWTGKPIPCRCRFNGRAYRLGEIVCMNTHVGTVLTRCDIFENNTSWIPSRQPCEPDAGT